MKKIIIEFLEGLVCFFIVISVVSSLLILFIDTSLFKSFNVWKIIFYFSLFLSFCSLFIDTYKEE